jgi:formyl-CoA transferase
MLPYSDRHWLNFFTAVGRPELMEDPRFSTYRARIGSIGDLYGYVGECTPERTTADWVAICEEQQIPCMPIADLDDLIEDEHLKAVGMFEKHTHPTEGETLLVRPPVNYSKTPSTIRTHAPRFGEHNAEVLREIGYHEIEIDRLSADGAVLQDMVLPH